MADNYGLPEEGKHLFFSHKTKKTIWRIYKHPDKVLDNFAIAEKQVLKKKSEKRWIVAKDAPLWIKSLLDEGYNLTTEEDK